MSTFQVPVVKYTLEKHPNADTLSIAKIKGWECIVRTADFQTENPLYKDLNLGVYVPLDAVADKDHPLLAFLEGKRVKAIRLRGVFSQGVLLPLEQVVSTYLLKKFPEEGDDLAATLNIKKWEPPVQSTSASVKGGEGHIEVPRPAWLHRYTDIENFNNYPDVLQPGEEVEATLKLHGTSAIFALVEGKFYICSRNRCLRTEERVIRVPRFANKALKKLLKSFRLDNFPLFTKKKILPVPESAWHRVFKDFQLERKLSYLVDLTSHSGADYPAVAIYGEIVGVQDLMYGLSKGELDFYVYDIRVEDSRQISEYVDPDTLTALCEDLELKKVPVLFRGPFTSDVLELRNGKDPIGKTHVREGIVLKPVKNRLDSSLGRVVLKRIGEDYLLRKNDKDETEFSLE